MSELVLNKLVLRLWLHSPNINHGGRLYRFNLIKSDSSISLPARIFLYAFNSRDMNMLDIIFEILADEDAIWDMRGHHAACVAYLLRRVVDFNDRDWGIMLYLLQKLPPIEPIFNLTRDNYKNVDGAIAKTIEHQRSDVLDALLKNKEYAYDARQLYSNILERVNSYNQPCLRGKKRHRILIGIIKCVQVLIRHGFTQINDYDAMNSNAWFRHVNTPFRIKDAIANRRRIISILLSRIFYSDIVETINKY